jgi:hypothetical protein
MQNVRRESDAGSSVALGRFGENLLPWNLRQLSNNLIAQTLIR